MHVVDLLDGSEWICLNKPECLKFDFMLLHQFFTVSYCYVEEYVLNKPIFYRALFSSFFARTNGLILRLALPPYLIATYNRC